MPARGWRPFKAALTHSQPRGRGYYRARGFQEQSLDVVLWRRGDQKAKMNVEMIKDYYYSNETIATHLGSRIWMELVAKSGIEFYPKLTRRDTRTVYRTHRAPGHTANVSTQNREKVTPTRIYPPKTRFLTPPRLFWRV